MEFWRLFRGYKNARAPRATESPAPPAVTVYGHEQGHEKKLDILMTKTGLAPGNLTPFISRKKSKEVHTPFPAKRLSLGHWQGLGWNKGCNRVEQKSMPTVRLAVRSGPPGGPVLGIAGLEFDITCDSTSRLLVIFCG